MRFLAFFALLTGLAWTSMAARVPFHLRRSKAAVAKPTNRRVQYPIVLWHGMGDQCDNPDTMGAVVESIEEALPSAYVVSLCLAQGDGDRTASYYGNLNDQVEGMCALLAQEDALRDGFHAVGFSQGGLFLRAVVQECGGRIPAVRTLVTMGSPHQGVSAVPACPPLPSKDETASCSTAMGLVRRGAYWPWVRDHVIQAQYFKDPANIKGYLQNNIFLPYVNNEFEFKNTTYADNLASLDQLVLFRFGNDTTLVPRDSAWFSDLTKDGPVDLRETELYGEDWLGLRRLDERGALVFEEAPGEHMHIALDWFIDNVVKKYLAA